VTGCTAWVHDARQLAARLLEQHQPRTILMPQPVLPAQVAKPDRKSIRTGAKTGHCQVIHRGIARGGGQRHDVEHAVAQGIPGVIDPLNPQEHGNAQPATASAAGGPRFRVPPQPGQRAPCARPRSTAQSCMPATSMKKIATASSSGESKWPKLAS
jgi:hypothetical protein